MLLWTFVVDFDGGTYISQGNGATFQEACVAWTERLRREKVFEHRTAAFTKALLKCSVKAVPLNGLRNAWCFTGLFANKLFVVNVILTSELENVGIS